LVLYGRTYFYRRLELKSVQRSQSVGTTMWKIVSTEESRRLRCVCRENPNSITEREKDETGM